MSLVTTYVFFLHAGITCNITANHRQPKAELRADDRDIPVGGSVTLTCSVNPSSSGWKYFWYRGEKTSEPLTSQLSAGPIRVSEGGVYWCRGGRGKPVNYTEYSDSVTIYKISEFYCCYGNRIKSYVAVVTLQPNRSEIYKRERFTLRCEIKDGGDTEWAYEWSTTSSEKPSDQNEHRIRFATESHSGDYRCKGRKKHTQHSSTDWSDSIKLTVSDSKSHHISFKVKIIQLIKRLFLFIFIHNKSSVFTDLGLNRIPTLFMDRHTQQNIGAELEEEIQCI
uniref:Ig-like domain-containing protein n=1 Tax=Sparus aurata TaxID=8175 RepID=A0A671UUV7_SPAAU